MTSTRLLALISLLQGGRRWPAAELAERLEVSPRTLRRDLDRLRDAGYAIDALTGPDGGYRLVPGHDLPPLLFDDDQVLAIAVALRTLPESIAGLTEAADRALISIRQVLPTRLKARIDLLEVSGARGGPAPAEPGELVAIAEAIRRREVLRFDYPGADGTVVRRAEPHHLVARGGRWYLIGWDHDRDDWRTYRVDRIRTRTPTGPRFERRSLPAGSPADYLAERIGGGPLLCRGTAVVQLPAEQVMPWVGPEASVEPDGPDRCRVTANSWTWGGLAAWFAFFDVDLELIEPAELITAGHQLADRLTRSRPAAG